MPPTNEFPSMLGDLGSSCMHFCLWLAAFVAEAGFARLRSRPSGSQTNSKKVVMARAARRTFFDY
jgi:hypothetical protein